MPNTYYTIKLEEKRNSKEVQNFKLKVNNFLESMCASEEISYRIKCDLSKKIDMPFYGEKKFKPKCILSIEDIAKEYIRLLIEYNDFDFSKELFSWLTKQQGQTFRKIHKLSKVQKERKRKYKTGVYEHPVPANYSRKFLLNCIFEKDYEKACRYIDYMSASIPQIFLTKDEDIKVNQILKDSMPNNWNWEKDSPFIRYIMAGISNDVYKE